jgi:hypothetical protein
VLVQRSDQVARFIVPAATSTNTFCSSTLASSSWPLRIKNSSPWRRDRPNLLPLMGWEFKRHVHVLGYRRGRHLTNRWCLGASWGDGAMSYRSMQNLVGRLSTRNHWWRGRLLQHRLAHLVRV